jgi:hypothetical protein
MATVKRYRINKEQLERVVENFVMEAASVNKKAPVKNHIPSQGAEAKKHVKNKMSGKMVEKGEGVPAAGKLQKKLPQAADAKKHMSSAKATHTNKAKMVRESYRRELINEGLGADIWRKIQEWYGSRYSKEKAMGVFNSFYSKRADKLSKAYGNGNPEDFKKAVIKFMEENGGIPLLDGETKNAEWNDEAKEFTRLGSKGRSTGNWS